MTNPLTTRSVSVPRLLTVARLARFALSFLAVLASLDGSSVVAQSDAAEKQDAARQQQAVSVSTHGISRYRLGRWGTLSVDAVNRSTESGSVESAAWISGHENDQFGRSAWMPAESRRQTWMPILIPQKLPGRSKPTLNWMGVQKSDKGEVFSTAENQDAIESRELIAPKGNVVLGVIPGHDEGHLATADLLRFVMQHAQPQVSVLSFQDRQLPAIAEALDAVHVLAVVGDDLAQNAQATKAVQDWVRLGGTLWLFLDTMTDESAQTICGGERTVQEVDRISLTSYSLLTSSSAKQRAADSVSLEQPVQLTRTFPGSETVVTTIDDWPAATSSSFGQGRIFTSMLSLDGFFVPRGKLLQEQARNLERQLWVTTAGQDLVSSILSAGSETPLNADIMKEYVTARIGYQLPVRSSGALVLAVFCVALIVVCGIVHRLQKPILLLPGVSLLSVLVVLVFLKMASTSKTTEDSAATLQMVEACGAQDRLLVNGVSAFHSQGSHRPTIESTAAGMLNFESPAGSGSPVRMLWSDQNSWQLQNVEFSAGVRLAEFRQAVPISSPTVASGTFDEAGFRGRLTGNLATDWSDAIVADQSGFALPVTIGTDGTISNDRPSLLPGQYLDSAILDAEQSRRQTVFRKMLDASKRSRIYPSKPTLLAWSAPLVLQTGKSDTSPTGAMLASFPLSIKRPESGSRIRIPSTFLPYRSVKNKKLKIGSASTFSNTRRTWSTFTYSRASTALLRFEIPPELLPIVVENAKLTLKISAPLREVEISSGHPDSLTDVWSKSSPVGTFEISFSNETSCTLDDQGGLNVALKVGAVQLDELDVTEVGTQDRNWQVEWIQLEIQGLIQ